MDSTVSVRPKQGISRVIKLAKSKTKSYVDPNRKDEFSNPAFQDSPIVKIEFTNYNCIILLSSGKVYSKGKKNETRGILNPTDPKTFEQIAFACEDDEEYSNLTIFNISAGFEHVLALDERFNIWAWGKNDFKQVSPKTKDNNALSIVYAPIKLNFGTDINVKQIFALNNTSMAICKDNKVYMWGMNREGFLTFMSNESVIKEENFAKDFKKIDKLTNTIVNEILKNDGTVTEAFINSRKMFNNKYNAIVQENFEKENRIKNIQNTLNNLKTEIESRKLSTQQAARNKNQKTNNKNILTLYGLLGRYEKKLSDISKQKEELRKKLIHAEEEINYKNIDLTSVNDEIDKVEKTIEDFNNNITDLMAKKNLKKKEGSTSIDKDLADSKSKLYYLQLSKESLMSNLQILIVSLEMKEKERFELSTKIGELSNKENEYLKNKYVVEDMINVLQDNSSSQTGNEDSSDKYKENFLELFNYSEQLDKINFVELDKKFSYEIIEDLLERSNNEKEQIVKNIENAKTSLSDIARNYLGVIFRMLETKIELISEQNKLIKYLYTIFTNLEPEIKRLEAEKNKDSNPLSKEKKHKHMEYIYKEMILRFLKENSKTEEGNEPNQKQEEKERFNKLHDEYLAKKKDQVKKLEERSTYLNDYSNINLDDVYSYTYEKSDKKKDSLFSFFGM